MRNQLLSANGVMKSIIPVFITILITSIVACNNSKTEPPVVIEKTFVMPDSLWYRGFKLDSATIANDPDSVLFKSLEPLLGPPAKPAATKLLLKISINEIHGDSVDLSGFLYAARGHVDYGKNTKPAPLKDTSFYIKLRSRLILGNNDIAWCTPPMCTGWKSRVFEKVGGKWQIKSDFGYLLFRPDDTTGPNCAVCDKHLHFNIELYDKNGNKIPIAGAGIGSSNPSPPADPNL